MAKRRRKCRMCTNPAQWTIRINDAKTEKAVCGAELPKLVKEYEHVEIKWMA